MGRVFARAIEAAGLTEQREKALLGDGLTATEVGRLRDADLLLVAALADEVRATFRGDDVRILSTLTAAAERDPKPVTSTVLPSGETPDYKRARTVVG